MNWKKSKCGDCVYFEKNQTQIGLGICRHSPPGVSLLPKQTNLGIEIQSVSAYPPIKADSKACGQFEVDGELRRQAQPCENECD